MTEHLSLQQCMDLLELYRHWNVGQRSDRPDEQAVYDARRKMLIAIHGRIERLANAQDNNDADQNRPDEDTISAEEATARITIDSDRKAQQRILEEDDDTTILETARRVTEANC